MVGADSVEVFLERLHRQQQLFYEMSIYSRHEYYVALYRKFSNLQSLLMHGGNDLFLILGRLLNAYRDNGHFSNFKPAVAFGVHDEEEWVPGSGRCGEMWESVFEFVGNDAELEFRKPNGVDMARVDFSDTRQTGFMKFIIGLVDYPFFDTELEFTRYCTAEKDEVWREHHLLHESELPRTEMSRSMYANWLEKKSVVYLYNSPYWTLGDKYISVYLRQRYGEDWRVQITEETWNKAYYSTAVDGLQPGSVDLDLYKGFQ